MRTCWSARRSDSAGGITGRPNDVEPPSKLSTHDLGPLRKGIRDQGCASGSTTASPSRWAIYGQMNILSFDNTTAVIVPAPYPRPSARREARKRTPAVNISQEVVVTLGA